MAPGATGEFKADLNPTSLQVLRGCKLEPSVAGAPSGTRYQFERLGYFAVDRDEPATFHRTVGLRDEWANIQKRRES